MSKKRDPERVVREIKRKTRRRFTAEEKILFGSNFPWGTEAVE